MAKPKERPLDRYPYMENNLKGWDNWFVTNEVYAVNQKIIHDRLDYLQEEIDNIEQHGYVTDEEFNEYKTEVTGNFTTINNQITSINTRLNNLPNIYVTGEEYNTYVTNTATTLTSLDGRITTNETAISDIKSDIIDLENLLEDKVSKTDIATDDDYGIIKLNSDEQISLNEDGQLEILGRLGQTEVGGLYFPNTNTPTYVGPNSLMITEATGNAANSNRIFALAGGIDVTLKVTAQPGATRFEISNTFANRFIAAACRGGLLTANTETAKVKTVQITNVYLANDTEMTPLVPYSGATESGNNIIIEIAEAFSDTDSLTKIRVYGRMSSNSTVYIGQNVGNGDTDTGLGKNLLLGQNVISMAGNNIVTGNSHYVGKNRCAVFGANHIIDTAGTLAAGYGHDTTNGSDYVVPLGQFSLVEADSVLVIGDGESNTVRHNIFEIKSLNGATGLVLNSPNGTQYVLTVADDGTLTTTPLTQI